ncbi:hypothetical protein [Embleya sp. NBC_00896]|nr:hypothetical protein OG928_48100 [Embleya sp. NBC_00896]
MTHILIAAAGLGLTAYLAFAVWALSRSRIPPTVDDTTTTRHPAQR